jgi:hypothetical protein
MDLLSHLTGRDLIILVPVAGGLLCAITAIIAAHWQKIRRAEIAAALKQDMLNRGMSADDIRTVLEAGSRRSRRASSRHASCSD